jgi:hypothetical protein
VQGGRGREGNDREWSGGHGMSVHVCGADLSVIGSLLSISRNTHWTYENPPAVGAGDAGNERGKIWDGLGTGKSACRGGGRFGRDRVDLAFYPRDLRKSTCCGCRRYGRRRGMVSAQLEAVNESGGAGGRFEPKHLARARYPLEMANWLVCLFPTILNSVERVKRASAQGGGESEATRPVLAHHPP